MANSRDDSPPPDSRCFQHTMSLQSHESRIGHMEDRIDVHDKTLFGFNGTEPGLRARVAAIEDATIEYRKNRFLVLCTLLACVIEGGVAIGIAAFK